VNLGTLVDFLHALHVLHGKKVLVLLVTLGEGTARLFGRIAGGISQKREESMRGNISMHIVVIGLITVLTGFVSHGWAQDKLANNMEIVHEKLKADKKLIVAKYMELTDSEAKKFWPVYEEYQKDLQKIDQRLLNLLQSYAADYRNNSLTDEKAKTLLDEWIAIDNDDAKRRGSYVPKVMKALPPKKAARYLQIENEYRILMKYDLAVTVPLVQ
jgi:hypothetical protein